MFLRHTETLENSLIMERSYGMCGAWEPYMFDDRATLCTSRYLEHEGALERFLMLAGREGLKLTTCQ